MAPQTPAKMSSNMMDSSESGAPRRVAGCACGTPREGTPSMPGFADCAVAWVRPCSTSNAIVRRAPLAAPTSARTASCGKLCVGTQATARPFTACFHCVCLGLASIARLLRGFLWQRCSCAAAHGVESQNKAGVGRAPRVETISTLFDPSQT